MYNMGRKVPMQVKLKRDVIRVAYGDDMPLVLYLTCL